MYDLFSFYRGKEWRKLLEGLKLERVNEEGQLICEYCGKPIVRAYDAIGHHKVELTEENVNDYSVSLNPDNVAFVHHSCHNRIHDKLGYKKREVFVVYGPPLAGKTAWVKDCMVEGDLVVDMDNVWECVSGCERYVKPRRLNAVAFKVRDVLIDAVKYRLGKWQNAYVIGGYPLSSERERLCKELGAREVFIDTSRDECMERLAERNVDKVEWEKFIDDWFERHSTPLGR